MIKKTILYVMLLFALFFTVRTFSAPFTAVYPQTVFVNTTLSTANHVLLFAYPFSLSQYRLFYNDSGNLYPLTQMVLDGAIVVQNYTPAWYTSIVLLNASSYGLNTSITPAYSFVAGSQRLLNNGGLLYSRNGYTCLSAPSAVSYLYVPSTLSVSGATVYFYGYVFNSTLDSSSRIGFSKTFGDVAYSSNPGGQAVFTTTTVYVADASYITYVSTSTAIQQNKLMLVMAKRSTYLTVWNYTSTWYNGATGTVGLAATTYYANIKVNTGKAVCAGLLALSTAPVPFLSASYVAKTVSVPLVVYSSQPFNVTYPKTYSSISLFLSRNVPSGSQKLTLNLPAGTASLLDSSMNTLFTLSFKSQGTITLDGTNITYVKVNGNVYYLYPSSGKITIKPPSNPSAITFTIQDYGAGYKILQVTDLQGNIVGSGLIGLTGQVVMNLTPYASYMITVCMNGLCKSIGLVTISSANIQLTVMPSVPSVKQPGWVSASYNYTSKKLIVNISCTSPPCNINIKKILANGTQSMFAQLMCTQALCSYALNAEDPYFTVMVSDASGKTAQTSTGMSVPLWQSTLGSVVGALGKAMGLDAWGVNVNDFIVLLFGLAIIYTAFTYRNWELAIIVYGVWLTLGTLLLGGTGKLVVPGLSLALVGAALSYMLKREQQP